MTLTKSNNSTFSGRGKNIITASILGLIILFYTSCQNTDWDEKSKIEVITIDTNNIKNEIKYYKDSTYVENPKRDDFWAIEHYLKNPNKEIAIFKDSLGNIVGYWKRINGKNIEGAEYYPNGQIIGQIKYTEAGILNGLAKYYYEDGRISRIGNWKNSNSIGIWKQYSRNGTLLNIEEFDEEGNSLNFEERNATR